MSAKNKVIGEIVGFTNKSVTIIRDTDKKKIKYRTNNCMMWLHIGHQAEFEFNSDNVIVTGTKI